MRDDEAVRGLGGGVLVVKEPDLNVRGGESEAYVSGTGGTGGISGDSGSGERLLRC